MNKKEQEYLIRIGLKIKELRVSKKGKKSAKMSQTDLSELIGDKHHTTIGRIERGEVNISLITLNKIAMALGTTVTDLIN